MQVILLERVAKLGQMGETVRVRDGYARNCLLPGGKALRATEANKKRFEGQKAQLEARNLEARGEAERVGERLDGESFVIIRQAGESGFLYGSVSTRDVADALTAGGYSLNRNQVNLKTPIKTLGVHGVEIQLHPEIEVNVKVNIARSAEEAERQSRGEDVNAVERDTLDDLGLEVGAALADDDDR